jgi:hypothetical protein
VHLKDLFPALTVRDADFDFAVESATPPEGWIERVDPVRRTNHHYLASLFEPVHQ